MIKYFPLLIVLLTGCAGLTTSDYQRPLLSVPDKWQSTEPLSANRYLSTSAHWWDSFNDPLLSQLIEGALRSNNDLAKAGLQVLLARNSAGLSNTNLTPDVSLSGGASNSKSLAENTTPTESYNSGLSLSYELDLWGKLSHTRDQSQWLLHASEQDRLAAALTMIGQLGQLYWSIANQNQQIRNVDQSLSIAQQTQKIVSAKYRAGAVSQRDLLQAEQTVLNRQNSLEDLIQSREANRNALAILFNRPPNQHLREKQRLDANQKVAITLVQPVSVISHRPDIQSAEMSLRAALSGLDAANASFFPSLSLTASLNAGSAIFSQWFTNPSRVLGTTLALPFIQWNTTELTIAKSRIEVQMAAITFRDKVYNALKEVDNALFLRLSAERQITRLQRIIQSGNKQLAIAQAQYRAGATDYQSLLDAQDALLTHLNALSDQQYKYLYATLQLRLALGGGDAENKNNKQDIYQ